MFFCSLLKKVAKEAFYSVPPNRIRFGSLRRLDPVSNVFGFDRGTPIDRYYLQSFLAGRSDRIRGRSAGQRVTRLTLEIAL